LPIFTYTAKKKNGDRIKDTLLARTRYEAITKLNAQDLTVISVEALEKSHRGSGTGHQKKGYNASGQKR